MPPTKKLRLGKMNAQGRSTKHPAQIYLSVTEGPKAMLAKDAAVDLTEREIIAVVAYLLANDLEDTSRPDVCWSAVLGEMLKEHKRLWEEVTNPKLAPIQRVLWRDRNKIHRLLREAGQSML